MKALLLNGFKTHRQRDAEAFEQAIQGVTTGDLRHFAQMSGNVLFPPDAQSCGSSYVGHGYNLFSDVLLGRSVRLFQCPWGRAFLRNAMQRTNMDDGKLHVSTVRNRVAERDSTWSPESLETLFGVDVLAVSEGASVATFPHVSADHPSESILDWYFENIFTVAIEVVLHTAERAVSHYVRSDEMFLECLLGHGERVVGGSRKWIRNAEHCATDEDEVIRETNRPQGDYRTQLNSVLKEHAYLVGGIAYKQPAVANIVRECCDYNEGLRVADFGGGYGLFAAEMCLDPDLDVALSVCCDSSTMNLVTAATLYRHHRAKLRGRFYFHLGKLEDFECDETFHVMTFFSSLLYAPVEKREATLRRCWEKLEEGGVLVVLENIKRPCFVKDYDRMFMPEELDNLLQRFGTVRYFASTVIRELERDSVEARTVFRVVRKQ